MISCSLLQGLKKVWFNGIIKALSTRWCHGAGVLVQAQMDSTEEKAGIAQEILGRVEYGAEIRSIIL